MVNKPILLTFNMGEFMTFKTILNEINKFEKNKSKTTDQNITGKLFLHFYCNYF